MRNADLEDYEKQTIFDLLQRIAEAIERIAWAQKEKP